MTVMMCTVGMNPAPVALAVLTCEPAPTRVLLVCSSGSRPVAAQLSVVMGALLPGTEFTLVPVGAGVSWRSCHRVLTEHAPAPPYRLDYTGGTTSMSMAAVTVHLERHDRVRDGGAALRSYVDEQSGVQVTDAGIATRLRTESVSIAVLAELHAAALAPTIVLAARDFPAVGDRVRLEALIEATRRAFEAHRITDEWLTAFGEVGMADVVEPILPTPEVSDSDRDGRFVELISLAAAVGCGQWDEIVFDGKEHRSQFDVLVRRGHRLVCIESKHRRIGDTRDDLGHRMSTTLSTFGGAARVHLHLLPRSQKDQDAATAFDAEIRSWKKTIPDLQRLQVIHTRTPAAPQAHLAPDASPPDPVTAMIGHLRRDLPAASAADGRGRLATPDSRDSPGTRTQPPLLNRGTVMTAVGGSEVLTALVADNEPVRTVVLVGPPSLLKPLAKGVLEGTSAAMIDIGDLSARSVWLAARNRRPETVIPTVSKKSAGAGLLRYAHECGAAIEHLLPRGSRELGSGAVVPMTTPPRWPALLTTEAGYRRHPRGTQAWPGQTHSLFDLPTLRTVVDHWARTDGVTVYISGDLRSRLVAPVVITHGFLAFAVTSYLVGDKPKWALARSFTAAQATVLEARFGPAIRTWVAMSEQVHRLSLLRDQVPEWTRLWQRLQMLSGVDEEHLQAPPWTIPELHRTIGTFLGIDTVE